MSSSNYEGFVSIIEKRGGMKWMRWVSIIEKEGEILHHYSVERKREEEEKRISRSSFWQFMSMGEFNEKTKHRKKLMSVIWEDLYLYVIKTDTITIVLGIEIPIEDFIIELLGDVPMEEGLKLPGLLGAGVGTMDGETIKRYLNEEVFTRMVSDLISQGKRPICTNTECGKEAMESITKDIFMKLKLLEDNGFGNGRYVEISWENVNGWMFRYGSDKVATVMFVTDKADTISNIFSYLLNEGAANELG